MTITMTSKNQITLPKKIVDTLRLQQGSLFDVNVKDNRIELIPLKVSEREFTDAGYEKPEKLYQAEISRGESRGKVLLDRTGAASYDNNNFNKIITTCLPRRNA